MQSTVNRNGLWLGLVMIIIVLIAGALVYAFTGQDNKSESSSSEDQNSSQTEAPADSDTATKPDLTIVFGEDGFTAHSYKVKTGGLVEVRNESSRPLQFSSDDHPTHRDEPALNTPVINPGQTTSFRAPDEPGEYGFHDHINSQYEGHLVVE